MYPEQRDFDSNFPGETPLFPDSKIILVTSEKM